MEKEVPQKELLEKLSLDINKFEQYFIKRSGSKLTSMEKEIVRAYLFYKIKVENKNGQN